MYKRKRALGVEFKMNNGKGTPCRKTGPPCGCKKNCYSLFSDSKRASIISEFSGLGDKDIQDSHC